VVKPQNTFTTNLVNILDNNFPDITSLKYAPFDIITSNPPYIAWKDYIQVDHSVKNFEDPRALFGGPSGLEFYHAIARLVSRGDMLETGRFRQTEIWLDPWERQRTVIAHM
jgi:methylase of polypeptide subunit release factors